MINLFFKFIKSGDIKIRIMFRQNAFVFDMLKHEKYENQYFLLYYQFIKHAFGINYCNDNPEENEIWFKLYLDRLPDKVEKSNEFKEHVLYLNNLFEDNINIAKEDIVEIDSKNHVILQCMDIILGSINFRLNDLHLVKIEVLIIEEKQQLLKKNYIK